MVEESLEAKIAQRKKEACEKRIGNKGRLIVEYLGKGKSISHRVHEYTAEKNKVAIIGHSSYHDSCNDEGYSCDAGWSFGYDVKITYKGNLVFEGESSNQPEYVKLYLPGKWEKTVDELYSQAQEIVRKKYEEKENEQKIITESREEALKNKWKL